MVTIQRAAMSTKQSIASVVLLFLAIIVASVRGNPRLRHVNQDDGGHTKIGIGLNIGHQITVGTRLGLESVVKVPHSGLGAGFSHPLAGLNTERNPYPNDDDYHTASAKRTVPIKGRRVASGAIRRQPYSPRFTSALALGNVPLPLLSRSPGIGFGLPPQRIRRRLALPHQRQSIRRPYRAAGVVQRGPAHPPPPPIRKQPIRRAPVTVVAPPPPTRRAPIPIRTRVALKQHVVPRARPSFRPRHYALPRVGSGPAYGYGRGDHFQGAHLRGPAPYARPAYFAPRAGRQYVPRPALYRAPLPYHMYHRRHPYYYRR